MKVAHALILAVSLAVAAGQAHASGTIADLDAYVHSTMKQWQVPGLAVAIVKDGKVVLARGYGARELGKPAKVDADTLFGIASNSKAFTAAALGTLVSAGKLHWNDPVVDYLKDFRLGDPYVTQVLTVRDALTHRSGYCDPTFMWLTGNYTSRQIIYHLRFQKPDFGLRTRFCYNNTMYLVAGEVVAAIAGESWGDYVRAHFFKPLGMAHTASQMAVFRTDRDVAVPHGEIDGKVVPVARMDTDSMAPVGGIKSSVADMAHWLEMLLANGSYHGHKILSPDIVKTMETPQMLIARDSEIGQWALAQSPKANFLAYGLGLFVQDYAGHKLVWHAGDIDGMASTVAMFPDEHIGVVVLSNMNQNRAPEAVAFHVLDSYLGRPPRDVSGSLMAFVHKEEAGGQKFEQKLAAARDPAAKPSLPLKDYAGTYHNDLIGDIKVTYENGHLKLTFGNPEFSGTLIPWAHDTFQVPWNNQLYGNGYVTFEIDALEQVNSAHFFGMEGLFIRKPTS
jgi:CubicO group peptidase (beta-lactamase class C family)